MFLDPCLVRFDAADGNRHRLRLGHLLLDDYLELVAARARPNTLLAAAWDLKVFFGVVAKDPVEVTTADVLAFISDQRRPRRGLGWCGWRTASRAWRPARSSGGWRAWGCSPTWWCVGTWRPTRCRVGWRHAGRATLRRPIWSSTSDTRSGAGRPQGAWGGGFSPKRAMTSGSHSGLPYDMPYSAATGSTLPADRGPVAKSSARSRK